MKKILVWTVVVLGIIVVLAAGYGMYKYYIINNNSDVPNGGLLDAKNGTYQIEGQIITLKNGVAEESLAPGSASITTTEYFGNEVYGDFNGDGEEDVAFLLTQSGGGTGVFSYVTALIADGKKGIGTNAIFIGDRIAPQSSEFRDGKIIINFADRLPGEAFSVDPSVGVSKYFQVIANRLVDVTPNLTEAEARKIAEAACIKGGEALEGGIYNEGTKTWWFDANLNATKEGCNPACVVSEATKTAEINWRCTGLIQSN